MRNWLGLLLLILCFAACNKKGETTPCSSDQPTVRKIVNKNAIVRVTATATEPVYLTEAGTIDSRLIPCTLALDYYQDGLEVVISGDVKASVQPAMGPCCAEPIVLTSIHR